MPVIPRRAVASAIPMAVWLFLFLNAGAFAPGAAAADPQAPEKLPAEEQKAEKPANEDEPKQEDDYVVRIHIANIDGSDMKPLTDLPDYRTQGSPCWSRDGKLIAFDAWRPERGENYRSARIVLVNSDGTNPRVLDDGAMPSFSPKAHRIAYSRSSPNQGVWVMNLDGPEIETVLLDDAAWGTDWSPDGTGIAYTKFEGGGANIVIYEVIEGVRRNVFGEGESPYRQIFWNFAWSADSRRIAFKGVRRSDQKPEIAVVDARGAKHGFLRFDEGDVSPPFSWTPDSRTIFFSRRVAERDNCLQLFALDPDGKEKAKLLPKQETNRWNYDAACSPDGKRLAISAHKPINKPIK